MKTFIIKITDEEEKACLSEMEDVKEWIENAIHNKARKVMDRTVEGYFSGKVQKESDFTSQEQTKIDNTIGNEKLITVGRIKQFPKEIKEIIVRRAKLSTPAERKAKQKNQE